MTHPITPQDRLEALDIVRGFALAGVFLINVQSMISWEGLEGTVNGAAAWFLDAFIVGKFYRLFAFMFGVGFALQMFRLESRGAPFVSLYLRRLAVLFGIGLVHGLLLWPDDVLALYAQLGLLLLLIRNVSNRTLIAIGIVCLFAAPTYYYLATDFADFRGVTDYSWNGGRGQSAEIAEQEMHRVRSQGSYRELVATTSSYFLGWQTDLWTRLQNLREEFLMLLLGLYFGRRRLFERVTDNMPFIRQAFVATLAVGVVAFPIISWLTEWSALAVNGHLAVTARQATIVVQSAAFSLFYGIAFLLALERLQVHRRLRLIGSIGQMTLTNYLLLSVLVTIVFNDFGLGLYGCTTVLEGIALAVVAYLLLATWSSWWLRRYRFGPAEWAWRSLTYGSMQPMKR